MPRSIDNVNRIDLKALQKPEPADPNKPGTPEGYLSLANCEAWIAIRRKPAFSHRCERIGAAT